MLPETEGTGPLGHAEGIHTENQEGRGRKPRRIGNRKKHLVSFVQQRFSEHLLVGIRIGLLSGHLPRAVPVACRDEGQAQLR